MTLQSCQCVLISLSITIILCHSLSQTVPDETHPGCESGQKENGDKCSSPHQNIGVQSDPPVQHGQSDPPLQQARSDPSVQQVQSDPPVQQAQFNPPVQHGQSDPPLQHGQSDPPVEQVQSDPPVEQVQLNDSGKIKY